MSGLGLGGGRASVEDRAGLVTEEVSELFHVAAQDPSLALYRVQEHVRKSVGALAERRVEVGALRAGLEGAAFDVANATDVARALSDATPAFARVLATLKSAMYFHQQLTYELGRARDAEGLRKSKSCGRLGEEEGPGTGTTSQASTAPPSPAHSPGPSLFLTSPGPHCPLSPTDQRPPSQASTATSGADSQPPSQPPSHTPSPTPPAPSANNNNN